VSNRPTLKALPSKLSALSLLTAYCSLLLALSGCAWVTTRYTALFEKVPAERRETRELVQSLIQRSGERRSLRVLASVYYSGTDGRGGFQEAVLVHRPDRLRLETLSPLGSAILIVTADAEEIAGFHPREGLFYRGKSSPLNLFRYTQIPLGLGEFTSVLMGLPPLVAQSGWSHDGHAIVRDMGGGWKEAISFHPTFWAPTKWQRTNPEGRIELSAQFGDFFATPAGPFPLKISLEVPTQQRRLDIRYQDPELNIDLAPALFVQQKPENAREVPIESLGG